jgi:hypothetical protein
MYQNYCIKIIRNQFILNMFSCLPDGESDAGNWQMILKDFEQALSFQNPSLFDSQGSLDPTHMVPALR